MKKNLASVFVLGLLLACTHAPAQINENIDPGKYPVDVNTKLICYMEVIQVPGVSAHDLMQRGLKWFSTYYKNPTEVIRQVDSLRGTIAGKARFKIYKPSDKKDVKMDGGNVEYSITLNIKEGKFRYVITEINWKQTSYFPVERWLDTKSQTYLPAYYPYYMEQTDTQINAIIENVETHMKTAPPKKNDDW
jgi:hypothetical protein